MMRRASGLYVQDLKIGTGAIALHGKSMVVRYTGWLASGKQFDSGEITVTIGAKGTIAAWEEGLLGMRVGGQRRLVVPPNLGYGVARRGRRHSTERGAGVRDGDHGGDVSASTGHYASVIDHLARWCSEHRYIWVSV